MIFIVGDMLKQLCIQLKTYFLVFIGASIYRTIPFGFVSKYNADRSRCFDYTKARTASEVTPTPFLCRKRNLHMNNK